MKSYEAMDEQKALETALIERLQRLMEIASENRTGPSYDYDAGRVAGFREALEIVSDRNSRPYSDFSVVTGT